MDRRGRAGYGMGLIADRGLEIVLLRVFGKLWHYKVWQAGVRRAPVWYGLEGCGMELVIVDRTFSQVSLRVFRRGTAESGGSGCGVVRKGMELVTVDR